MTVKRDIKNQIKVNEAVLSKILANYDLLDFDYSFFERGIENTTLKISTKSKKYVLRIYRQHKKPNSEIELELKFQDLLRVNGLPIPETYSNNDKHKLTLVTIDKKNWQTVLLEYKEGEEAKDYSDKLLRELAQIQAKMHLLGIEFANSLLKIERKIDKILKVSSHKIIVAPNHDETIKNFMLRANQIEIEDNPNLPHGYNHLDLDIAGNILIKDNSISAILDFDDLTYTPCALCLANTLWHILFVTKSWEKVHLYIAEYEKTRQLTGQEKDSLKQYILFRNYVIGEVDYTLHQNYQRVKEIIKLEEDIIKHHWAIIF